MNSSDDSEQTEDSLVALYRSMDAQELYAKKMELIKKYREIAYELYLKYVRIGAEFEINVDYATRKRFQKLMGNKQEWINNEHFNEKELQSLFHGCIQRMFTFLSNSFTRFRDKPDFDRVIEFLVN